MSSFTLLGFKWETSSVTITKMTVSPEKLKSNLPYTWSVSILTINTFITIIWLRFKSKKLLGIAFCINPSLKAQLFASHTNSSLRPLRNKARVFWVATYWMLKAQSTHYAESRNSLSLPLQHAQNTFEYHPLSLTVFRPQMFYHHVGSNRSLVEQPLKVVPNYISHSKLHPGNKTIPGHWILNCRLHHYHSNRATRLHKNSFDVHVLHSLSTHFRSHRVWQLSSHCCTLRGACVEHKRSTPHSPVTSG